MRARAAAGQTRGGARVATGTQHGGMRTHTESGCAQLLAAASFYLEPPQPRERARMRGRPESELRIL
eukprot:10460659-Alexandrium_andersonii.AAC.1